MKGFVQNRVIGVTCLLLTSIALIFNASGWTVFVNLLSFGVFVGTMMESQVRSMFNAVRLSFYNIVFCQFRFIRDLASQDVVKAKFARRLLTYSYMGIPVIIIVLFFLIYRVSNPVFDGYVADLSFGLSEFLSNIFSGVSWQWLATLFGGMIISVYPLVHVVSRPILDEDSTSTIQLNRVRRKIRFTFNLVGLKNEFKAGLFLLIMLNALIAIINAIDIYWVWFNFEWEGEYLKQFVHEGTYLLILSILISVAIVLYFFRGNLNFYFANIWLKRLCYAWLAQNAILALSVAIRNIHYIDNFALAGKRIGVMFFIALVLFGIYSVFVKVRKTKSNFYLFHVNTIAILLVLVSSALPNWSALIASYNFNHAHVSFLHLDYLSTFDVESLPYLDHSLDELRQLEAIQKEKFPFEEQYMSADEYYLIIQDKKTALRSELEEATWQEWTWPRKQAADYLLAKE
jgi:hypothetical protein